MSTTVKKLDENTFEVTVSELEETKHRVGLSEAYYQKLTGGAVSKEILIEESFDFLLARETNTMILAAFDLSVIQKYFPEYESTIQKELSS